MAATEITTRCFQEIPGNGGDGNQCWDILAYNGEMVTITG